MRCGKCKASGPEITVTHVRSCYGSGGVAVAERPRPQVEAGIWIVGDQIVKVQAAVHGSGNLYAKQLDTGTGKFKYVPGLISAVRQAGRKMTLADAEKYGAIYGMCVVCGRTLTAEDSIARSIGPICAGKLG